VESTAAEHNYEKGPCKDSYTKAAMESDYRLLGASSQICVFCDDLKSKMTTTTDHSINTGPYGEIQKYFLL
jgi:thioredoxin-related protein